MSNSRHTILVSAYACEPLKGSEPGVGWNWVLQMAKNNRLHVITRSNNREPIETQLPNEVAHNIFFHYYDTNNFIRRFKNKTKGLYFYYFCWQMGIISLARRLIKQHNFDYTMHLTFGSIWLPTFLPFFNTPFIWGPVGGGEGIPKSFLSSLTTKQRAIQWLRYLLKYLNYANPFFIYTCYKAISIISRTNNTLSYIPAIFRHKTQVFLETSMEPGIFHFQHKVKSRNPINLIIIGRLVPFKNIITAIKSLKYITAEKHLLLKIIGSGPEKERIIEEILLLNLSEKVSLVEEMTRENVINELVLSDVCLFPSLREGGSWALMEAMAIGLPVICLKWSGMEIITDEKSAIRLPVTNPDQMPKDMAAAICKLIDEPDLRREMGAAGRERIRTVFNWEAKADFMNNLLDGLDDKCKKLKYLK